MKPKLDANPEECLLNAENLDNYQKFCKNDNQSEDVCTKINGSEKKNGHVKSEGFSNGSLSLKSSHEGFAQLILERGDLSGPVIKNLIDYFEDANMAATMNQRKYAEPEEDIAAIAKQISDHAEAIYQNWKSRGLAPTEILSCNNMNAAEKFNSALTPGKQQPAQQPPVDILSSAPNLETNNLEQLVNKFVVEDKARLARQRNTSPTSVLSSVQFAKQKFESKEKAQAPTVLRNFKSGNVPSTPAARPKSQGFSPGGFVPGETVETTLPRDMAGAGLQTWPLKRGPGEEQGSRRRQEAREALTLEQVKQEEEKLINALKSGLIIAEEPKPALEPKPNLLEKKILKEKPTGLVKRVVKSYQEKVGDTVDGVVANNKKVSSRRVGVRGADTAVPHPEVQKPHLRTGASSSNPVRPFLTRGSVAERVLIFEKAPAELGLDKRKLGTPSYSKESLTNQKPGRPPHTTLQRHARSSKNLLPRFYFPHGKASSQAERQIVQEAIRGIFLTLPNQQATLDQFNLVTKACRCPLYWKASLFVACGGEKLGYVELNTILDYWRELTAQFHDSPSRFLHILTRGARDYLLPEDFMSLVQDVVDTHPGLNFLKEAVEFHSRYVHTVISRIFYNVNSSWSGRITLQELRRSNLLSVISLLETEEDINQITQYFSYEHFYVIYCKFWELDRDHDLLIDKYDLTRHSDHALSTRIIDRIFSGAVTRGKQVKNGPMNKMSYTEFVWFLLAEEDKSHPRAIEYWFRCMDLDGDGYLSMYELEYFYDEQLQRMETIGMECLPFEDCLCQMLDMIRPSVPGKISLSDLKKCRMTPIFFDTFFNLEKYLDHEQRDPFASQRDHDNEMSDWDRYAAEEYELLVAEEGGTEAQDPLIYEYASDEDILSPNLDEVFLGNYVTNNNNRKLYWQEPNVTVTTYEDFSDSADYADSDSSV